MEKLTKIAWIVPALIFLAGPALAQAEATATGTSLLTEVKQEVLNNKTYTSIFMIAGVVAIVGLAIYLSFSNEQDKNTAKK